LVVGKTTVYVFLLLARQHGTASGKLIEQDALAVGDCVVQAMPIQRV
jgi:hypothetical protein